MTQAPLALTPGEPAGIGPDLVIQLAQKGFSTPIVIVANRALLTQRAKELDLEINIIDWNGETFHQCHAQELIIQEVKLPSLSKPGQLEANNAEYVLSCLDLAIDGCLEGRFSGMVTGPIHKGIINDADIQLAPATFSGHTEYLQQRCKVNKVVMMLASPRMRVALATTHVPLKDVAKYINYESLHSIIEILIRDLQQKFSVQRPRILVAGLNPHAGEEGHMGREEIDILRPVMDSFKSQCVDLVGPLPADTLFNKKYLEKADAVLAMYHDQGLPVLKFDGFGESVNITLGLPIIRTSVDHGTALDIAGRGLADSGSLKTAIELAAQMALSSPALTNSSTIKLGTG